ncbi:MAG: GNAT family N-acetyltransferase [Actinobacteria bacterium]|nr:GNAT family N-acetyltransferase [Actinomycetota bacterium]
MFVTRATRHDKADIEAFLEANWQASAMDEGQFFFARDGGVVGCVRFIEIEPQILIVEDMVVDESRRGQGIGRELLETVMNSKGGTLYLRCFEDLAPYYERFGFSRQEPPNLPPAATALWRSRGDLSGGETVYLRAR